MIIGRILVAATCAAAVVAAVVPGLHAGPAGGTEVSPRQLDGAVTTVTTQVRRKLAPTPTPTPTSTPTPTATARPSAAPTTAPAAQPAPSFTPTPSATPSTTPSTTPADAGLLTVANGQLVLHGQPYRFTGVNAYELTSEPAINAGCGTAMTDAQVDALFGGLRPDSLVRLWGFPSLVDDSRTGARDWRPLDRVVSAAAAHGQRLIVTLTNQWGDCEDGTHKTLDWYTGGYRTQAVPGAASYWDFLAEVAARYKGNPTIGMWELVNEPEGSQLDGSCPDEHAAATGLRDFFDAAGERLKSLDPTHLISSGMIGNGQCGAGGDDYTYVHESPGIDVASLHDYDTSAAIPGDRWNGMMARIDEMKQIGKPIMVGEAGIQASDTAASCRTRSNRSSALADKLKAQLAAGVSGFLPWDYVPTDSGTCAFETITPDDPVLAVLKSAAL